MCSSDLHPEGNVLTRALGIEPTVEVDVFVLDVAPKDRFLLCTDGLIDEVSEEDTAEILWRHTDPQECADALVARALVVGRGPWGNLYEFTVAFAFGICAATIVFDRSRRLPALSAIALGVALALLAYAATLPNAIVDLVPALQHPLLLTIHVGMAMLSYGI